MLTFHKEISAAYAQILTPEAQDLLVALHQNFNARRLALLQARQERQARLDKGEIPDFLPETAHIRQSEWKVAPIPADLQDRRVEITGPVDRKMIINALNSGAKVFMADFEDSNSPSWDNNLSGQLNLHDANRRVIDFTAPNGKAYSLKEQVATLMVRPRGWHLVEKNITIDGEVLSGSLMDFGLYMFHNAKQLVEKGSGPYFYLPKLESHLEARLWNDVIVFVQNWLELPNGTVRATVLIETILATFELNEILWELRDHSAGLNCGRWDYIFSYIKKLGASPNYLLPDRAEVTMAVPMMAAYAKSVVATCHKRGVHAMGGMAAQIPIKNNPEANATALEKVKNDKLREVKLGHDGTWVAHPDLVKIALDVFNEHMPTPNQISVQYPDFQPTASDILAKPAGNITESGIRVNVNVGILYLKAWLEGNGAVAIHNLMEDAATAEISRTQVWQWLKHGVALSDGRTFTNEIYRSLFDDEVQKLREEIGTENKALENAITLFDRLITAPICTEFLTLPAYELI